MQKAAFVILICQTRQEEAGPGGFPPTSSPTPFAHAHAAAPGS